MFHRIGVFDSGIGGLTVLRQLRRRFPGLDMVYLGDLARVPYGGRSPETIAHYAADDVRFLLRYGVEAVVVACGTVSATALDGLRERFPLPIYGVIESAARRAAAVTKSGCVGVIGTQATIRSDAYRRHIQAIDPAIRVLGRACPLFVPLVEDGVGPEDPVAELVVDRYLRDFDGQGVDALIMGCTHYPVYRAALERRLPGVTLIDVGEALSASLEDVLGPGAGAGQVEYYVTERSAAFDQVVRIMDAEVDPADIRVENYFIGQ